ncbi:hypothetical protein FRC01_000146 [Tulasnella sp. 417]|nr:hypothetical protein FRC01_000146 [Tulasnella sp. 417]
MDIGMQTTNNLASFGPVSSVAVATFPQPQHPPLFNLERPSPFTAIDYLSSQVKNLQLDQAFGPPPIPPRPRQPPRAYDGPFTLDLSYSSPPSPSLLLSPSIDGSPLMEPQQLPFPLIPQPLNQPASQGPLPETRAVRSKGRGSKGRSEGAPLVPRVERRITKNGKPYSRDRPHDLMPRPGQRLLTRRSWTVDEHDIASRALEWYEAENPTFVVSKSTMEEQHVAFPMIFLHIVEQHPDWRRGYEGLLTWATKTKGRPTTRKRAGRGRWIASKPVVRKPKATPRKRPATKA